MSKALEALKDNQDISKDIAQGLNKEIKKDISENIKSEKQIDVKEETRGNEIQKDISKIDTKED